MYNIAFNFSDDTSQLLYLVLMIRFSLMENLTIRETIFAPIRASTL